MMMEKKGVGDDEKTIVMKNKIKMFEGMIKERSMKKKYKKKVNKGKKKNWKR